MKAKLCKLCHERPAAIPDRERYRGVWRKEVCRECHAARLRGDWLSVLHEEARKAADGLLGHDEAPEAKETT